MRVISGNRRGAKLITRNDESVRPTTDRVKESMFNLIMDFFPCTSVLDLFSGSGALSIEALSRGAESAICVDIDSESMSVVKQNYSKLKFSQYAEFHLTDAFSFLKQCTKQFDIIFLDPPYNKGFISPVMELLQARCLLNDDGVIVLESDSSDSLEAYPGFCIFKQKTYGRTVITLYKKEVSTNENSSISRKL